MNSIGRTLLMRFGLVLSLSSNGLPALGQKIEATRESISATAETKTDKNADEYSGKWVYRSFISTPTLSDETKPLSQLLFGQGNLEIKVDGTGKVSGTLGGDGWQLKLDGTVSAGNPSTIRFTGTGKVSGENWVYDYIGHAVPKWPKEIDQRPAIVGTIIRTVPHSGGKAQAGYVAQWISVHRIDEDEVRQLEKGWANAVETNDPDQIGRFFGDNFVFVDPNGNVQSRAKHLDDFRTGKLKVTSVKIQTISFAFHDTSVIATMGASVEGSYDGRDISGDYDFVDSWLLIQGRLRVVTRKQTKAITGASTDSAAHEVQTPDYQHTRDSAKAASERNPLDSLKVAIKGKTSVLLFVKGSFCPHCMSQVSAMSDELVGRDVSVFVISASTDKDLKNFPKAAYHLIADPKLEIFKAYGAFDGEARHATVLLDEGGYELFRDVGNEPLLDPSPVLRAVESQRKVSTASLK